MKSKETVLKEHIEDMSNISEDILSWFCGLSNIPYTVNCLKEVQEKIIEMDDAINHIIVELRTEKHELLDPTDG